MKLSRMPALLLAAILIISYVSPALTANANTLSETASQSSEGSMQQPGTISDNHSDILSNADSSSQPDSVTDDNSDVLSREDSSSQPDTVTDDNSDVLSREDSSSQPDTMTDDNSDVFSKEDSSSQPDTVTDDNSDVFSKEDSASQPDTVTDDNSNVLSKEDSSLQPDSVPEDEANTLSVTNSIQGQSSTVTEEPNISIPSGLPMFSVTLDKHFDGYVVIGHFTEFLPDTAFVQPQSSLDGETWQDCGVDWNLSWLGDENPNALYSLQNQICLYDRFEPLKNYLAGELDSFYLRLRITRENGMVYETQAALIEREAPTPLPEEITYTVGFAPSMLFREMGSSGAFIYCGKYQLTINAGASPEDIAALLPDTLPVSVELQKNGAFFTDCIIECPVTWKPISLSGLTPGESITIRDAAEEVVIPAGTPLCTPMGTFTLSKPLGIEQDWWLTDEIVLVLNVVAEDEAPTGVLAINNNELQMAFGLKPTGATAIRAYTLTVGDSEWKEIPGISLLDAINGQPSTANSGYTTILNRNQEPYRSYLAAEFSHGEPKPFLVGLKIEGGIYNGCQLILTCPDTYDLPPGLIVGGSGGNEGNAGSGNKDDSTEEGQRPNLPQDSTDAPNTEQAGSLQSEANKTESQQPSAVVNSANANGNWQASSAADSSNANGNKQTSAAPDSVNTSGNRLANPAADSASASGNRQTNSTADSVNTSGNRQTSSAADSVNTNGNRQTSSAADSVNTNGNRLEPSSPDSKTGHGQTTESGNSGATNQSDISARPSAKTPDSKRALNTTMIIAFICIVFIVAKKTGFRMPN